MSCPVRPPPPPPGVTEPRYTYANGAALQLFESRFEELVGRPSRSTTAEEPGEQTVGLRALGYRA